MYSQVLVAVLLSVFAACASANTYTARMTFYNTGLGSCGYTNSDSEYVVAVSAATMSKALCGCNANICYKGKCLSAKIVDTCPGCPAGGLDASPSLFSAFANQDLGHITVTWSSSCGGSAPAVAAPAPAPAPAPAAATTAAVVTTAARPATVAVQTTAAYTPAAPVTTAKTTTVAVVTTAMTTTAAVQTTTAVQTTPATTAPTTPLTTSRTTTVSLPSVTVADPITIESSFSVPTATPTLAAAEMRVLGRCYQSSA